MSDVVYSCHGTSALNDYQRRQNIAHVQFRIRTALLIQSLPQRIMSQLGPVKPMAKNEQIFLRPMIASNSMGTFLTKMMANGPQKTMAIGNGLR